MLASVFIGTPRSAQQATRRKLLDRLLPRLCVGCDTTASNGTLLVIAISIAFVCAVCACVQAACLPVCLPRATLQCCFEGQAIAAIMMRADKLRMVSVLLLFGPCVARVLAADGSGKGEMPPQAPIIGILSQPLMAPNGTDFNVTYFPMSYPEYAAMGGARTVAVLCDTPVAELKDLYHSINGLIVPGAHMTTNCSVMWCHCRWTKLHDNHCMMPCASTCSCHGTCNRIA